MKSNLLHIPAIPVGKSLDAGGRLDPNKHLQLLLPGYSKASNSTQPGDVLVLPDGVPVLPTRRLIVVVPGGEIDQNALARRVWRLASVGVGQILFFVFEPDELYIPYERRRLKELTAMTSGGKVRAQGKVSAGAHFLTALEEIIYPGDLVVCLASHQITHKIIRRRALGDVIAESLQVPVFMLAGINGGATLMSRQWIKEVQAWIASLCMIALFLGLQIMIVRSTTLPVSTILVCLSIFTELFSLWEINKWIG